MTEAIYDRIALAKEQLETALDLFLDQRNYSAAVTLAGAAEEIFGGALTIKGGKSALDSSYESMDEFHRMIHGKTLDKKSFVSQENIARDALKHLQESKGPTITVDLQAAACWMLVRALKNGRVLGLEFERFRDFDNWFYENVVGV